MTIATVIGATTWGNTVARVLANKDIEVKVWARTKERTQELLKEQRKLPEDAAHSSTLHFTSGIQEALDSSAFVIIAMPAQRLRSTVTLIRDHMRPHMTAVSLAKGLEAESGKRMTQIIAEESAVLPQNICVLSGPNLSQEINRGLPATAILAGIDSATVKKTRDLFNASNFTVFASDDVIGVELCGALKNVVALGAGMVDGLGLGNNAKATFITMGWEEITALGSALGARQATFYGLAGLGDLITTCAGSMSRNHYVGREVASGRSLAEVKASMSNIAEGIDTTIAAQRLAREMGLDSPIIQLIYQVLFESLPPLEIARRFEEGLKTYR